MLGEFLSMKNQKLNNDGIMNLFL